MSCRYHLYVEVNPITGSVQLPFGSLDFDEIPNTCALDAAAMGPLTIEDIGRVTNKTRQRVLQIQARSLALLQERIGSPTMAHALADWIEAG